MFVWLIDKLLPPAIVAVIFSYLTNMFLESHRAQRDSLSAQVNSLRDDLLDLWRKAAEYWSHDFRLDGDILAAEQILLLEQDLRFRAMEVASRLEGLPQDKMKMFLADLADELTSGDFGTIDKKAEPSRLPKLRKAVIYLRDALLTARNANFKSTLKIGH